MKPFSTKPIITAAAVLGALVIAPNRLAHGCAFQNIESVHFNTYSVDFGTPIRRIPRGFWDGHLWVLWSFDRDSDENGDYPDRRYTASNSARLANYSYNYDSPNDLKAKVEAFYVKLGRQIQSGRWAQARQTCLEIVKTKGRWTGDLRDRTDLLTAILGRPRFSPAEQNAVKLYLDAVEEERKSNWTIASNRLKQALAAGAFLKDRVNYQEACIAFDRNDSDGAAAKLFRKFGDSFPHSPKREDALIMVARMCILKDAPDSKTTEAGLTAIRQLLAAFPHTRFYDAALGLRARVHLLRREYGDALWCYYRLGDLESVRLVCEAMPHDIAGPASVRLLEAYLRRIDGTGSSDLDRDVLDVRQVNHLRNLLSLEMIRSFQTDLKTDPALLVSYIYYRLYYTNARIQDLANLAVLARSALSQNPRILVLPSVAVRLAEVEYQQRHFDQSIIWSAKALRVSPGYDRALFIRGSAEEKLHRLHAAHADLANTLRASKDNALRTGARQLLALVCEQQSDYSEALNQYVALGYNLDAAYLLDVRMNTRQIEAYLHRCTSERMSRTIDYTIDDERNQGSKSVIVTFTRTQLLEYTLGIHFLRQEKWGDASRWLTCIPARLRRLFDTGRREYGSNPSPDALTAVQDLARLRNAVSNAHSYEAKAAAAYRYASYYHNHGALLLYNPMLWEGARVSEFEEGWNKNCQTPADMSALRSYFAGHEVYLRSRELCLAVARRYPKSRVAPQALYRAACASERAGGALAVWYEDQAKPFQYVPKGEAAMLMHRVVNLYPHSPLVPSAIKYAGVFAAADPHPAGWPHYASAGRSTAPHLNSSNSVDDAEILLAALPGIH